MQDMLLGIALLRSGKQPEHMQDIGMHVFTYSLLPHGVDFVEGGVVPSAFELNNPVLAVEGKEKTDAVSFFTLDNPEVEIDAVKKSEDGKYLVVRFHDFAGSRPKVTLKPGFAFSSWSEGDLSERRIA